MRRPRQALCHARSGAWLLVIALASCRVGYDTVSNAGPGGAGPGGTTSATSGANAGGVAGSSAGAPVAQGGNEASAGLSGDAGGGIGGAGGSAGDAGSAGDVSWGGAPSCDASVDCSCAEFEGHAYWFCPTAAPRAEAEARCAGVGMTLARIDSQRENDHLLDTATTRGVFDVIGFAWIGASDVAAPGEWRWSDGTQLWQGGADGMPVGSAFNNWTGGSPSVTGAKDCAGLLSDGTWQDRSCTAEMPAICESP